MIDFSLDTLETRMMEGPQNDQVTRQFFLEIIPNNRARRNSRDWVRKELTYEQCVQFAHMDRELQNLVVLGVLKNAKVLQKKDLVKNYAYFLGRFMSDPVSGKWAGTMLTDIQDKDGNLGSKAFHITFQYEPVCNNINHESH